MKTKVFLALSLIAATILAGSRPAVATGPSGKINHVIYIIQENRTPDNLFHGFPGADIANSGLNHLNATVPLTQTPLVSYDVGHEHRNFITEYNNGAINGWDNDSPTTCSPNHAPNCRFAYVNPSDVYPYFEMGEAYAFADRMFGIQAPSLPAHQYFIRGSSLAVNATPVPTSTNTPWPVAVPPVNMHPVNSNIENGPGGGLCPDNQSKLGYKTGVNTVDPENFEDQGGSNAPPVGQPTYPPVYPCYDAPVISDEMDTAGVSWTYYESEKSFGLWKAMYAIAHIYYGPDNANVVSPSTQILTDIANGNLSQMSWVIPDVLESDHPGNDGSGPAYVAAIVNAIGKSSYWNDCAIVILWDDWGGWYDHVPPIIYNSQDLGFRVPMIVISPYAKNGYVSHNQHEFGSVLHFIEEVWTLPSLGTSDARGDDMGDMFDFTRATPRPFGTPIPAPVYTPELDNGSPGGAGDSDSNPSGMPPKI